MATDDDLNTRWDQAVLALLSAPSIRQAARKAGVADSTLREWLQIPAFQSKLKAARLELMDRTLTDLVRTSTAAVRTLERNLSSKAPPMVQIRAATALLDLTARLMALADLKAQIDELREQLGTGAVGPDPNPPAPPVPEGADGRP